MKPKQRLLESSKDRSWRRDTLKYWNEMKMNSFLQENDLKNLKLAAGQLDHTDYTYLTNPFGMKDDKYKQYPAKLRNFDFISPLFLRWISEYNQRVFEPVVFTRNSNFENEKLAYEKKLIDDSLQQQFINSLIEGGLFDPNQVDEAGNPVAPPMSPDVIKAQTSSLPDTKTITGQHAIDYIRDKQDIQSKFRQAFDYFIKINKCVTYKDVRRDQVILEVVSPLDVAYYGNRNVKFLELAEAITVDYYLSFEEVMEIFGEALEEYTEEYGNIIDYLENEGVGVKGIPGHFELYMKNRHGIPLEERNISEDRVTHVRHILWTSFRKVKKVLGENGEVLELTEDYQGDDVIEEVWYPEERDGWVIADRFYVGGFASDIQRVDADNPYSTKKPYNGKIFMQGDVQQSTAPEKLFQYQEAYNATRWKMQSAINKDKGKIMTMPIGLMQGLKDTGATGSAVYTGDADSDGKPIYKFEGVTTHSEESAIAKTMYYADATGIMYIDETSDTFIQQVQGIKAIDMSLGNWIEWLANQCRALKQEAENLLGFNDARTGAIKASETVGNSERNYYSGSLITEEYFTEFEEFQKTELQGLLDLSKFAFRTGKTANYVRSNRDVATLQIDEGYGEASYGIFIHSSARTKEVSEILKSKANEFLQNYPKGGSIVAKLIAGSNNYANIIQEIEAKEEEMQQMTLQQQEADRQNQLQLAQIAEESKQADRDLKVYEIDTNAQVNIAKAGITGAGFNIGKEGGDDIAGALMAETNKQLDNFQKNQIKAREIMGKEKIADQNNKTKLAVVDKQLAIARENKGQ